MFTVFVSKKMQLSDCIFAEDVGLEPDILRVINPKFCCD